MRGTNGSSAMLISQSKTASMEQVMGRPLRTESGAKLDFNQIIVKGIIKICSQRDT